MYPLVYVKFIFCFITICNKNVLRQRLIIGKEMGQIGKTRNQFIGNVANVNIYSSRRQTLELKNMTLNCCNFTGDYLAWTNMKFTIRFVKNCIFKKKKNLVNQK